MAKLPPLPTTLPGGVMVPFLSARRRHEIADIVFENLGGVERLTHESDRSPAAYWEFIKSVWSRGLPKAVSTEHSVADGVESLLERLDHMERAAGATVIENVTDAVEVSDAED